MLKGFWQKIKQNHLLMMVACCLIPIALVVVFVSLFGSGSDSWFWLIILFCPLMHLLMMRGHKGHNSCEHKKDSSLYQCPECGLKYQEKEWAEKCENWCKEHKSCNLEIIKHAINKKVGDKI